MRIFLLVLAGLAFCLGLAPMDPDARAEDPDREALYRRAEGLAEATAWILDRYVYRRRPASGGDSAE